MGRGNGGGAQRRGGDPNLEKGWGGKHSARKFGPEGWGPEGWGPERWGPKGGAETVGPERVKGGGKKGGGPKISRFFFPSPAPIFILFFSLWGSSRVFFSLSGCLLVSFFFSLEVFSWNFGGVLVGRDLKCACLRPRHENTRREKQKDTRRSPERKIMKMGAGEGKKSRNFGRSGGRRSCGGRSCGGRLRRAVRRRVVRSEAGRGPLTKIGLAHQNRPGHQKSARHGQQSWPKSAWPDQNRPKLAKLKVVAKVGLAKVGRGQSRSLPLGRASRQTVCFPPLAQILWVRPLCRCLCTACTQGAATQLRGCIHQHGATHSPPRPRRRRRRSPNLKPAHTHVADAASWLHP